MVTVTENSCNPALPSMTAPQQSLIHRLPSELILEIARHLKDNSLGHFRQTCIDINAILLQYFDRKFFRIRRCMVEHESLEALLEIACHPRLACVVEQVDLYNCMYGDQAEGYMEDVMQFWRKRVEKGYLPRETLISTGQAQAMLIKSFSEFPNLRTIRMLEFSEQLLHGNSSRPWGWGLDPAVDRIDYMVTEDSQFSGLVPMILSALGRTQARPTTIEISLRDSKFFPGNAFIFPNKLEVFDVLKGVEVLDLNLGSDVDLEYHEYRSESHFEDLKFMFEIPLRTIMHRFTSLHTLRLSFESPQPVAPSFLGWLGGYEDGKISTISTYLEVESPRLATLSILELGTMYVGMEELIAICSRFLLTSLVLEKVGFVRQLASGHKNYWRIFLPKLAKALGPESRLRRISFCKIGQRIECSDMPRHDLVKQNWEYVDWKSLPKNHSSDQISETGPLYLMEYDKTTAKESVSTWLTRIAALTRVSAPTSMPY